MSALLTICEFVLGTFLILCLRNVVNGVWLFRLHLRRFDRVHLKWANAKIRLELIAFVLTAWFTFSIAFVEFNLSDYQKVTDTEIVSPFCGLNNVSRRIPKEWQYSMPFKYQRDDTAFTLLDQVDCEHGIEAYDFGPERALDEAAYGDGMGNVVNSSATMRQLPPTCVPETQRVVDEVGVEYNVFEDVRTGFELQDNLTYIFPYNGTGVGRQNTGKFRDLVEDIPECTAKGISPFSTFPHILWFMTDTERVNNSRVVLRKLCESHEGDTQGRLDNETLLNCVLPRRTNYDARCLRASAANSSVALHYQNVSDAAVMLVTTVPGEEVSVAYACPDATVELEYVFVSESAVVELRSSYTPTAWTNLQDRNRSILLPLRSRVVSGHCEKSQHAIGLSALIYTARDEWGVNNTADQTRKARYHAYFITMARFHFSKINILTGTPFLRTSCNFKVVQDWTSVSLGASFYVLLAAVVASVLIVALFVGFRLLIPATSWGIPMIVDATRLAAKLALFLTDDHVSVEQQGNRSTSIFDELDDARHRESAEEAGQSETLDISVFGSARTSISEGEGNYDVVNRRWWTLIGFKKRPFYSIKRVNVSENNHNFE